MYVMSGTTVINCPKNIYIHYVLGIHYVLSIHYILCIHYDYVLGIYIVGTLLPCMFLVRVIATEGSTSKHY